MRTCDGTHLIQSRLRFNTFTRRMRSPFNSPLPSIRMILYLATGFSLMFSLLTRPSHQQQSHAHAFNRQFMYNSFFHLLVLVSFHRAATFDIVRSTNFYLHLIALIFYPIDRVFRWTAIWTKIVRDEDVVASNRWTPHLKFVYYCIEEMVYDSMPYVSIETSAQMSNSLTQQLSTPWIRYWICDYAKWKDQIIKTDWFLWLHALPRPHPPITHTNTHSVPTERPHNIHVLKFRN